MNESTTTQPALGVSPPCRFSVGEPLSPLRFKMILKFDIMDDIASIIRRINLTNFVSGISTSLATFSNHNDGNNGSIIKFGIYDYFPRDGGAGARIVRNLCGVRES